MTEFTENGIKKYKITSKRPIRNTAISQNEITDFVIMLNTVEDAQEVIKILKKGD